MESRLKVDILPQPDDITCGPTCLHAVYDYFDDPRPLPEIIAEVSMLAEGGTLGVLLANHALRASYRVIIYTYKLQLFDPTWFHLKPQELAERLRQQMAVKADPKLRLATEAYLEFLELGGEIRHEELTTGLIRRYLNNGLPIITGLSSTYLYQTAREYGPDCRDDDIRGEPAGHFVVLAGYDREKREVLIADPYRRNPLGEGEQHYHVSIDRVLCSILLGVLTYDGNLIIIRPRRKGGKHAEPDHR